LIFDARFRESAENRREAATVGRTEAPLEPDGSAAVECAIWLRRLRRDAGLTYPEIAERTHYAASSLQGVCAGRRLPSKKITLAFVEACGGDLAAWEQYWRQLQRLGNEPGRTTEELRPPWAAGAAAAGPGADAAAQRGAEAAAGPGAEELPAQADPGIAAVVPASIPGRAGPEFAAAQPDSAAGPAGEADAGRAAAGEPEHLGSTDPAEPTGVARPVGWLPRALGVAAAAALFAAGLGVGHVLLPARHAAVTGGLAPLGSVWEREMAPGGVPSYRQPGDTGSTGPAVTYGSTVRISCAVVSPPPSPASVPDMWLRVQSAPWDGRYYVPASDFLLAARSGSAAVAIPSC
jgi:transcriptional regulator with XRE-family HTH domain